MPKFTFHKSERLKSRKRISLLFEKGKVVKAFPLKFIYNLQDTVETTEPVQVGVTVPIRNFRKAVARNRVKRVMREAYRIHKAALQSLPFTPPKHLDIMIIYVGREASDYATIEKSMIKGLSKLASVIQNELE